MTRSIEIALAIVEIAILVWVATRVRRIVAAVRARPPESSRVVALEDALATILPVRAVASLLATELAAVGLALTGWFRRPPPGFSMHRRTSYLLVIGVIVFLALVESVGAHLVVAMASPTAAWVLTGLTLYSILWLLGDAHAVRLSPLRVTDRALVIEKGLRWRAVVPREDLVGASPIDERVDGALDLSLLGPNVLLELRAPVCARGLFGRARTNARIMVSVDDRDAFLLSVR